MPRGVYIRTEKTRVSIRKSSAKFWLGKKFSEDHIAKMKVSHSNARWDGHVTKPRKPKQGLWERSQDPIIQLEKKRFANQRYKARKREAEGSHTFEEWLTLKSFYRNMCLCCKQFEPNVKLTEDHIIPLSMAGGTDNIDNIQPLCGSCNTRKHAKAISYLTLGGNGSYLAPPNVVGREREIYG